jgi:hypothetical protein
VEPTRKDKPVIHEKEVIVPLDPAQEEKPTLVERERIEREQAMKGENGLAMHEEEVVAPLPDEEDEESAEEEERTCDASRLADY